MVVYVCILIIGSMHKVIGLSNVPGMIGKLAFTTIWMCIAFMSSLYVG